MLSKSTVALFHRNTSGLPLCPSCSSVNRLKLSAINSFLLLGSRHLHGAQLNKIGWNSVNWNRKSENRGSECSGWVLGLTVPLPPCLHLHILACLQKNVWNVDNSNCVSCTTPHDIQYTCITSSMNAPTYTFYIYLTNLSPPVLKVVQGKMAVKVWYFNCYFELSWPGWEGYWEYTFLLRAKRIL